MSESLNEKLDKILNEGVVQSFTAEVPCEIYADSWDIEARPVKFNYELSFDFREWGMKSATFAFPASISIPVIATHTAFEQAGPKELFINVDLNALPIEEEFGSGGAFIERIDLHLNEHLKVDYKMSSICVRR